MTNLCIVTNYHKIATCAIYMRIQVNTIVTNAQHFIDVGQDSHLHIIHTRPHAHIIISKTMSYKTNS